MVVFNFFCFIGISFGVVFAKMKERNEVERISGERKGIMMFTGKSKVMNNEQTNKRTNE